MADDTRRHPWGEGRLTRAGHWTWSADSYVAVGRRVPHEKTWIPATESATGGSGAPVGQEVGRAGLRREQLGLQSLPRPCARPGPAPPGQGSSGDSLRPRAGGQAPPLGRALARETDRSRFRVIATKAQFIKRKAPRSHWDPQHHVSYGVVMPHRDVSKEKRHSANSTCIAHLKITEGLTETT